MQRKLVLLALIALPLLSLSPKIGHAGDTAPLSPASCSKDSTGAGYCYGTLGTFRSSPDSTAWASFFLSHQSSATFSALFANQYYSCGFPTGSAGADFVTIASQPNTYFYVFFDRTGTCTGGYAYAMSQISD